MKKNVLITVVAVGIIVLLGFLGLRAFVGSIAKQRTCEWANIDNIEIHAKIDIPKIVESDCKYDKATNIKMSSFTLDKSIEVADYVNKNNLNRVDDFASLDFRRYLNIDKASVKTTSLYHKNTSIENENSYVLLDASTKTLWVTIEYQD